MLNVATDYRVMTPGRATALAGLAMWAAVAATEDAVPNHKQYVLLSPFVETGSLKFYNLAFSDKLITQAIMQQQTLRHPVDLEMHDLLISALTKSSELVRDVDFG